MSSLIAVTGNKIADENNGIINAAHGMNLGSNNNRIRKNVWSSDNALGSNRGQTKTAL